jgi:hypothetical protein
VSCWLILTKKGEDTWAGINSLKTLEFWHAETFASSLPWSSLWPRCASCRSFSAIILEWLPTDTNSFTTTLGLDTGGKPWLVFIQFTLACMLISKHMWLIWKKSLRVSLGPLMAVTILFVIFHQPQTYAGDICRPATASLSTVSTPKMVWTTTFFCRGSICSPPRHASQTRIRRVKDA